MSAFAGMTVVMSKHRILIFGGSGQVGQAFCNSDNLPSGWHIAAPSRGECDLMNPADIARAVREHAPGLVINAAAMVNPDDCEAHPDMAREINFHAVANIAAQCDTASAPLIHLSTDYVFDGSDIGRPYEPDDAMNPVNVYGQTKMMGEEAVRHSLYWHVILRTSLIFSAYGQNTLTRALRQIDTQDEATAAIDIKTCPTGANSVADALITIGGAILKGKGNGFGTFHICGEPPATRFEFLQAVMEAYAPYTEARPTLLPISGAQPGRALRPAYTAMNCDKARAVYGIEQRAWRDDLATAIVEYADSLQTA